MILEDISSLFMRSVYGAIRQLKETHQPEDIYDDEGVLITSKFINTTKRFIFDELLAVTKEHSSVYGELVLAFDNRDGKYWRYDFLPMYKFKAPTDAKSEVNFEEVFVELGKLQNLLKNYTTLRCIDVPRTEADDVILVLARRIAATGEKVLIRAEDKDFVQLQRHSNLIKQYAPRRKKYISAEDMGENMDEWLIEHVCLGDKIDGILRVVDGTEFTNNFMVFMCDEMVKDSEDMTPFQFIHQGREAELENLISRFDVYKLNQKKQPTHEKDVYEKRSFGIKTLLKQIEKLGSLDAFLDSHPLYRRNYELNYKLVMEEGIPQQYRDAINTNFDEADTNYNRELVEAYMKQIKYPFFIDSLDDLFGAGEVKKIDASFFDQW